jgi:hypothetical protein
MMAVVVAALVVAVLVGLIFVLALCRSAAVGDRDHEATALDIADGTHSVAATEDARQMQATHDREPRFITERP